jgi:hypothetical protein
MKIKCECGKLATWYYMPAEHKWACCDDCVPRGCSCWEWNNKESNFEIYEEPEGVEGKDWEWVDKGMSWRELDGEGKQIPCVEWWYDKEGWDDED